MVKYFINPFGVGGDLSPIPDSAQPSGSISYAQGFPINYEYPQTQPGSLDIPRDSTNQLFFDITSNLQQYQQNGTPFFITASDNGGSPYLYSMYSTVLYDPGTGIQKYMSKKNSNTDLPSVIASWWIIDNTSNSVVFDNADFDPSVNQGDIVYFDSVSSTFKQAIANGAEQQNALGVADINNSRIFISGFCNLFSSLSPGLTYYLSTTTAGKTTNIIPILNIVNIGNSISTTNILLNIKNKDSAFNTKAVFASASMSSPQTVPTNSESILNFDSIVFDDYSFFNTSTYEYTLKYAGYYEVSATLSFSTSLSNTGSAIQVYRDGNFYARLAEITTAIAGEFAYSGSAKIYSDGSQTIYLTGSTSNGPVTFLANAKPTSFFDIIYLGL